ncbi:uncharacterized protein LOC122386575 isoform X2 [Amphibalanus amphitrite]|uniref:uncharacterized protein LOC122386575 isoform X2 n=1 Tax=Amphibalanus amphitrite TaxID=1232801 RepID=UPI001C9240BD|nr:uncharacterized protein LOC122386575 isoform X2 [Amphibalanus amphitrite]
MEAKLMTELDRALRRWQRAAPADSEGAAVAPARRRARCRPRPRHQRLAWHLWRQLHRRLCRRQAARQQRRQAQAHQQTRCVWGNCSPPPWPLSLTSDYHSDGRETPATGRSATLPPPADASLSSAYSWDVQPSPRSLPSSPPQERDQESPAARSDGSSSSSAWSSVHESDCECSLQLSALAVGSVGQGARRRSVPERVCRRRRTHARRETRWPRCDTSRYDGYRSSDEDMDAERGPLPASFRHLKTPVSFSMSSLQPAGFHTPETAAVRLRADRPYNSLCRKRKERSTADPSHRQSWGSEVSKDSFWEALEPSYAFLMADQLIESCKEASGDLTWDATDVPGMDSTWSYGEFMDQYNELYQWLNEIQVVIYSSPKNITDRRLRESHMEEIQRKSYRRTLLAEQSCRLQRRQPELREEVQWRLAHLTAKWDTLLQCVRPPSPPPAGHTADPDIADIGPDIAHEVRCLEQWFHHMDGQLGPISFRLDLRSTQEATDKLKQYQALHDEVKSHQRIVSGVCRLCVQLAEEGGRRRLVRVAERLDTSWQQIYLRAYEWTCHLEGLLEQFKQGTLPKVEDGYSADEDEREPLSKVRRLGNCDEAQSVHSDTGSFFEDDYLPSVSGMRVLEQAAPASGPASPAKSMEREVLDRGYSSENSGQSSDSSEGAGGVPLSCGVRRAAVNTSNVRLEIVTADGAVSDDADDGCRGDESASRPPGGSSVAGGGSDADGDQFSSPQRPADNCATFYFRHSDTESERAPRARRPDPLSSDLEYASPAWPESDSDWLNNSGLDDSDLEQIGFATAVEILSELGERDAAVATDVEPGSGAAAAAGQAGRPPPPPPCDSEIHRLVERAESLVRADLRRSLPPLELDRQVKAKGRRVREWLRRQHGRRACEPAGAAAGAAAAAVDVSGQVTDSSCDASGEYTTGESDGDEGASSASEDLTCSMITCHELATPTAGASPPAAGPALLDMTTTPKVVLRSKKRRSNERPWSLHGLTSAGRLRPAALSVSETALNEMLTPTNEKGVTSSSSNTTVSAGAVPKMLPNSASFDSPFWGARRRSRPHRHSATRSSGSEGSGSSPTHRRRRSLRSSGSEGERGRVPGMSAAESHRSSMLSCTTEATLVEVEVSPRTVSDASPRDPPEEVSSVSEQAWDTYQELKEVTELGSEGSVDPDAVRRLLDCDDYRRFIDSHSDCASSQVSSVRGHTRSPAKRSRRKPRAPTDSLDSDSDCDELQSILAESRDNLTVVQAELERRAADPDATYSSILATCRSELSRLEQVRILVNPLGLSHDPASACYRTEVAEVTDVIQRWEALRSAAMERQQSADNLIALQERTRSFRHALRSLDERVTRASTKVESVDELQAHISALQALQAELADRRRELVAVNTDVHGFVTSGGSPSLKEDIATLYRLWDEINHRARSQLEQLSALQCTWRQFQAARAELTAVLEGDRLKLGLLREALLTGGDVGSRVQDVARVLTERSARLPTETAESAAAAAPGSAEEDKSASLPDPLSTPSLDELSEGTSGYDSACSDDLSERERRLGRLRRMARDLEALVSPASPAWNDIETTLSSATSELRDLQQSCRDLVIKTTCQYQPGDEGDCSAADSTALRRKSYSASRRELSAAGTARSGGGRRGWLWRVLRAALPFQLALMLCFCVACLLEPHCCDNLNNLSMSLTPQLRYMRGPPPI